MLKLKAFKPAAFALLFVLLTRCVPDAPHDNPFDPFLSGAKSGFSVHGNVYTYYQPYQAVQNAQVFIREAGYLVQTDAQGSFMIDDLEKQEYTFIISKQGFQTDTAMIDLLDYQQNEDLSFFLNAVPQITAMHYYSEKISTIFESEPVVDVYNEIIITDADGTADIDSVKFCLPDFDLTFDFQKTSRADSMILRLEQKQLTTFNLHNLIEKAAYIVIKDKPGYKAAYGPFYLGRIIETTPQTVEPGDQQTAIQPIFFNWEQSNLPYDFTYEIYLYRQQSGLQSLVYQTTGISSEASSFGFSQILPNGIYFWTLAIRDKLNNMSRSQEAVFQVQ